MYISATKRGRARLIKACIYYAAAALFLHAAALIYARFSHGVSSNAMRCACAYPFAGALVYCALAFVKKLPRPCRAPAQAFACGLITLALGGFMRGVFEIYGTTSAYTPVYAILGATLTATGAAMYTAQIIKSRGA